MTPEWWALPLLEDETIAFYLSDPSQGELLSAEAWRCGVTARPMTRATFQQIATSLHIDPVLICFHVERTYVPRPGQPAYEGGMMFVFRDDALTPEVADRLKIGDQIPQTREDVWLSMN